MQPRTSGAVPNALDKLAILGVAEPAALKPRSFRLALGKAHRNSRGVRAVRPNSNRTRTPLLRRTRCSSPSGATSPVVIKLASSASACPWASLSQTMP